MSSLLCVRKAYQMTVISVVLVIVVTLITVAALYGPAPELPVCQAENPTIQTDASGITILQWISVPCSIRVEIQHYVNDELHAEHMVPTPFPMAQIETVECSLNTLIISTIPMNDFTHLQGSETKHFEIGFSGETKVQNLAFNPVSRRFEWEGTQAPERCDVQYNVDFTNGDASDDQQIRTTNEYFDPPIHPCTDNQVTVTTWLGLFDREAGIAKASFVEPAPGDGEVQDLHFSTANSRFEWRAPENYDRCQLLYRVSFSNGYDKDCIETEEEFHIFTIYSCTSNDIAVQTSIGFENGRTGATAVANHDEPVPANLEVRNLEFDTSNSRFVWEPPENSRLCYVRYEVVFNNGFEIFDRTSPEQYFDVTVYPCSDNRISVTTLINGAQSNEVEKNYRGPLEHPYPEHISTDPDANSADVTWSVAHEPMNWCNIERYQFVIWSLEDEQVHNHDVDFQGWGNVEAILDGLQPNRLYEYKLCQVFVEAPEDPQCNSTVIFRTIPLTVPKLTLTNENNEGFDINWSQDYDDKFVTGHIVTITRLRPLHFLSESCEEQWRTDVTEHFFPPEISQYQFTYGLSSFEYRVNVITDFGTLGMQTRIAQEVETTEGIPGHLSVSTSYQYEPLAPYNVALKARWGVPCDINGDIASFNYKLNGIPKANIAGFCSETIFNTGVIEIDTPYPELFSLEVPGLLPFFEYSLDIETILREGNSNVTTVKLEDVPQPHNPPQST